MTNKKTKSKDLSSKQKKRNKQLSSVRSKVEHPFRILKCQFWFREVMYKWLVKNSLAIIAKLALWNLYHMRRKLMLA
jgi:IS5 family transposase